MKIIANPHFFSNLVLCFFCVFILWKKFKEQKLYNSLLLGVFVLCIFFTAISDLLAYLGLKRLESVYEFFLIASTAVGPVCLVSACWSLIRHKPAGALQFGVSLGVGMLLMASLIWYDISYLGIIIQSFCILLIMLISILGLAAKQQSALWIIIAMVLYALIAKAGRIPLPMAPKDMEHYLLTLTLISMGKAFTTEFRYIF